MIAEYLDLHTPFVLLYYIFIVMQKKYSVNVRVGNWLEETRLQSVRITYNKSVKNTTLYYNLTKIISSFRGKEQLNELNHSSWINTPINAPRI